MTSSCTGKRSQCFKILIAAFSQVALPTVQGLINGPEIYGTAFIAAKDSGLSLFLSYCVSALIPNSSSKSNKTD